MKIERISLLMGWMVCFAQLPSNAQEFKEHISKEFTPAAAHAVLAVYNISGSVKVVGYSGNKVVFDIDKTISAKSSDELEAGKKEFRLEFEQLGDTMHPHRALYRRPSKNRIKSVESAEPALIEK